MVDEFRALAVSRGVKIDEESWTKDLEFIKAMIRFNIDEAVFDIATARQHLITVDPQAKFGISKFPEAEKLSELARNRSPKVGQ
jgi:hypothetical protein